MTNLVVLQLDKDTGRIFAGGTAGGSVPPPLPPGCYQICGYIFVQGVPSAAWIISHNTGLSKGLVQIYDSSQDLILPDEVTFLDTNTVIATFSTAITGQAYLALIDDL